MASSDRTASVILKYEVDRSSVNRVRASFDNLDSEIADLRAELNGISASADSGVSGLRARFASGTASIEQAQAEVEDLRRKLLQLGDLDVTPTVDVQSTGGSRGGGALNTVDRLGSFGSQISGAFGQSSGLGNVVGVIGDVADSVGTLGVVGGVAALAVGAVSIALNDLKDSAEKAAAAAEAQIEGSRAAQALQGAPRDQIEARRQEILRQIAFEEQSVAAREATIAANDAYYAQVQASNAIGATSANIVYLGNDLTAASDAARSSINLSNAAILQLSTEFKDLTTQLENTKSGLASITKGFADAALTFNKGGTFAGGIAGGSAVDTKAAKAAQEAQAAALAADRTDAYFASLTATVKAQEAVTAAQQAYNAEVAASGNRIAEINAKLQADLSAAETSRQNDLADAARNAGEERVRITEDAERERARILRRYETDAATAVAERDALAAKRAEDQKNDELKELDERGKQQLKAVDKSLAAQQRTIEARYQAQQQTINAAAQAAVRTEQQASAARLSTLQQAAQVAQTQLINAQNAEALIRNNYYNQSIQAAQVWSSTLALYTQYAFALGSGSGSYTGGGGGATPRIIARANGGPVVPGQAYLIGERGPEVVAFPAAGRVIPNGGTYTLRFEGATVETIDVRSKAAALRTVSKILDHMAAA